MESGKQNMGDTYSGVVRDGKFIVDGSDEPVDVFRRPDAPQAAEAAQELDLSAYEGRRVSLGGNLVNGQLWGAGLVDTP